MTAPSIIEHEVRFVEAFVIKQKQNRYLGFIRSEKRRDSFTRELYHFRDLDTRFAVEPPTYRHDILALLKAWGAPDECVIFSDYEDLDRKFMNLSNALEEIGGLGVLVSCIPGKLAYYEGEGPKERYLLVR